MTTIEMKAYRKILLNFVYYNFLFRYTLTKTMQLNRASASVHGELINVAMLQLCSSMEFITWVGLMLSVHGKNGMHLIFLGNLFLKFLKQSLLAFSEEGGAWLQAILAPSSMLRGLPHPLLSVSWGNMTSHVSKLWHGESQMRLKPSKHLLPKLILKLLRQGFGLTSRRSWSFPWWISGWRTCSRGEVFLYIQRCKYWGSFEKWHILFGEKRGWIILTKKESCLLAPSARANVLS